MKPAKAARSAAGTVARPVLPVHELPISATPPEPGFIKDLKLKLEKRAKLARQLFPNSKVVSIEQAIKAINQVIAFYEHGKKTD